MCGVYTAARAEGLHFSAFHLNIINYIISRDVLARKIIHNYVTIQSELNIIGIVAEKFGEYGQIIT